MKLAEGRAVSEQHTLDSGATRGADSVREVRFDGDSTAVICGRFERGVGSGLGAGSVDRRPAQRCRNFKVVGREPGRDDVEDRAVANATASFATRPWPASVKTAGEAIVTVTVPFAPVPMQVIDADSVVAAIPVTGAVIEAETSVDPVFDGGSPQVPLPSSTNVPSDG